MSTEAFVLLDVVPGRYLGYNSLKDFFPTMEIKPSAACVNPLCRQRQQEEEARRNSPEALAARAAEEAAAAAAAAEAAAAPLHDDNEWGIEVVSAVWLVTPYSCRTE